MNWRTLVTVLCLSLLLAVCAEDNTTIFKEYENFLQRQVEKKQKGTKISNAVGSKCSPCVCGVPNGKIRIVGGQQTQVNEYPWMVMLLLYGQFFCGGSLINDKYILTAAHCLQRVKPADISVRLMVHKLYSDTTAIDRKVSKVIVHSSYSPVNFNNDIGLLKLESPVVYNDLLRPVCLASGSNLFAGKTGVITGWGSTSEGGSLGSTLQEVRVPIITNKQCRSLGLSVSKNMICAGDIAGGKDSCQGDSGGPMLVARNSVYEQVGIVSFGDGCAHPKRAGVYTRVSNYASWIKTNTADACNC